MESDAAVEQIIDAVSNWNRWSENDERGTINYTKSDMDVNAA